jgi:hypothetical protein
MRARTVLHKAYVFDLDDCLIKSNAKVKIYNAGKFLKSLSPAEYNTFKKQPGDELDFSEFENTEHILNAEKYKMWPVLKNITNAINSGKSTSEAFILTARHPKVIPVIFKFLKKGGITMPLNNIIAIGDTKGNIVIADKKKEILNQMIDSYSEVYFFDDDHKNIEMAKQIPGIKTRLIESDI